MSHVSGADLVRVTGANGETLLHKITFHSKPFYTIVYCFICNRNKYTENKFWTKATLYNKNSLFIFLIFKEN